MINSCAVYIFANEFVLIGKRGNTAPTGAGLYNVPVGLVEYNENPINTAIREVYEETGINIKNNKIIDAGNETYGYGKVGKNYIVILNDMIQAENGDGENDKFIWVNINDIDRYHFAFNMNNTIKQLYTKYVMKNNKTTKDLSNKNVHNSNGAGAMMAMDCFNTGDKKFDEKLGRVARGGQKGKGTFNGEIKKHKLNMKLDESKLRSAFEKMVRESVMKHINEVYCSDGGMTSDTDINTFIDFTNKYVDLPGCSMGMNTSDMSINNVLMLYVDLLRKVANAMDKESFGSAYHWYNNILTFLNRGDKDNANYSYKQSYDTALQGLQNKQLYLKESNVWSDFKKMSKKAKKEKQEIENQRKKNIETSKYHKINESKLRSIIRHTLIEMNLNGYIDPEDKKADMELDWHDIDSYGTTDPTDDAYKFGDNAFGRRNYDDYEILNHEKEVNRNIDDEEGFNAMRAMDRLYRDKEWREKYPLSVKDSGRYARNEDPMGNGTFDDEIDRLGLNIEKDNINEHIDNNMNNFTNKTINEKQLRKIIRNILRESFDFSENNMTPDPGYDNNLIGRILVYHFANGSGTVGFKIKNVEEIKPNLIWISVEERGARERGFYVYGSIKELLYGMKSPRADYWIDNKENEKGGFVHIS